MLKEPSIPSPKIKNKTDIEIINPGSVNKAWSCCPATAAATPAAQ